MRNAIAQTRTRSLTGVAQSGLAFVCACLAVAGTAGAQSASAPGTAAPSRLLTPKEGRAILEVAWQQELPARSVRDCSHFVHEIYANAGFDYPYARSFDIYAGHDSFTRVKYPRAGDLIAWPGHVGIVVDPAQHTFYSLVRTGVQELDYLSPYWRSRGRPRFFRFKIENGAALTASRTVDDSSDAARARAVRLPVGPSMEKPEDAGDSSSDRPPGATPKSSSAKPTARSKISSSANQYAGAFGDDEEVIDTPSRSPDRPSAAGSQKRSTIYGPPAPPEPADLSTSANALGANEGTSVELPDSVAIATNSPTPTREQVLHGISQLSDVLGGVLRKDDPFGVAKPVVVVEQFSVEKVETKRGHGWARVAIDSKLSISGGSAQIKRRHDKVRWELRLVDSGWEALPPADCTYVRQDVAVKNLAAQLARLAASDRAAQHDDAILREEAQIAGVLSALLDKK